MPSQKKTKRLVIDDILPADIEYVADITNTPNDIYDIKQIMKFLLKICPSMFSNTACGTSVRSKIIIKNIINSNDISRIANLCRISIFLLIDNSPDETRLP